MFYQVPSIRANDKDGRQQDFPSQSMGFSEPITDDEEGSDNNNDVRWTTLVRRILLIILSSIVLIPIGIICIVGTYVMCTRKCHTLYV